MDIFSHFSDPLPFGSDSRQFNAPEMSSPSDGSSRPIGFSDEEVLLASTHPKRRAGRKKFRETRHPVFRGVRRRNSDKWVCEVREPNKKSRIWLGTFPTAEMAARAHDVAALALKGRSACLNFADSAWRLPIPFSADAKDIQKAAAEAAEAFRPDESDGVSSKDIGLKNVTTTPENVFYMDEEEPGLLASMAEGLLLSPPPCVGDGLNWDYLDSETELSLWSYSI